MITLICDKCGRAMFQVYFTNEKYFKKVKVYRCLECDIIAQEKSKKLINNKKD